MQIPNLIEYIASGKLDGVFAMLYPDPIAARTRYIQNLIAFQGAFGEADVRLFSAPGRTEIGGNHTDHQNGCVLAAAVHLDVIACAAARRGTIEIRSAGYPPNRIDLCDLSPARREHGSADALVRGVCAYFAKRGYAVGGFCACTASNVTGGAGLSSSAAFSVLVGTVLSRLYNGGRVPATEIARAGQYAENEYFGKPSGLMDQMAAAVGGFVGIDFGGGELRIEPVQFDFGATGHSLCIVDTRGSHADLTDAYAAVRREMNDVAKSWENTRFPNPVCRNSCGNCPACAKPAATAQCCAACISCRRPGAPYRKGRRCNRAGSTRFSTLSTTPANPAPRCYRTYTRPARGKNSPRPSRLRSANLRCRGAARAAFTAAASAGRYRHLSRTSCSAVTAPRSNMYSARAHVSWSAYAVRAGSNFRQVHNGTAQQNNCASGVR